VAVMNEWTATLGLGSEWSFSFILDPSVLYLVRGHRMLHTMELGDGLMFCTSYDALYALRRFITTYWSTRYNPGKIKPIADHQLVTARLGSRQLHIEALVKPKLPENPDANTFYRWNDGEAKLVRI
jgi:hypothetical protein